MKRYFSISLSLFLFSALNALTYLLLGIIYNNLAFSEIFSLTYPLQFVVAILLSFFASSSNIRANKENNKDCVFSGMILGLIAAFIIFAIIAIFIDKYILFMNMDPEIYRTFTLMAIGQLFFSFVANLIAEKLYYEDNDKKANLCNVGFIILNLITVSVTTLITKNQIIIMSVNLLSLFIYCLIWFTFNIKKFQFNFSIKKNFKFESMYIISNILMLIIYLFGYRTAFGFGSEYVIALNFVNLITDPQWDALESISKIAKIEISQSKYNYKKAIKFSSIITTFFIGSSIILFFALFNTYNVVLKIGLIYLGIQAIDMILNIFKANLQSFLQLEYSPTKCTIIYCIAKAVRTILSITILSPYNTNIAQLAGGVLGLTLFAILRFKNYKLDKTGFLQPKIDK